MKHSKEYEEAWNKLLSRFMAIQTERQALNLEEQRLIDAITDFEDKWEKEHKEDKEDD